MLEHASRSQHIDPDRPPAAAGGREVPGSRPRSWPSGAARTTGVCRQLQQAGRRRDHGPAPSKGGRGRRASTWQLQLSHRAPSEHLPKRPHPGSLPTPDPDRLAGQVERRGKTMYLGSTRYVNTHHSSLLRFTWPLLWRGTRPRHRRTGLSPREQGTAPQPDRSAWPHP